MNYTSNYHLPQWEKSDRILMDDFNQMCASIDGGIRDARAEAETARSEAAEAAKLPYAVGTYIGNGTKIEVDVGFSPRFIIITTQNPSLQDAYTKILVAAGRGNMQKMIGWYDRGFTITEHTDNPGTNPTHPRLNTANVRYSYIVFR